MLLFGSGFNSLDFNVMMDVIMIVSREVKDMFVRVGEVCNG